MASEHFSFFDKSYQNGNIYIQDVRKWLKDITYDESILYEETDQKINPRKRSKKTVKKYDIIVHDVFSSAGLSPTLFTQSFFQQLKRLLKTPQGLLAVNTISTYKGELATLIANTLMSVFEYVECVVEDANSMKSSSLNKINHGDSNQLESADFHNFIFYASDSLINIPKVDHPASVFDRLHEKRVDIWSWNTNNSFVITEANCNILAKLQSSSLVSHYNIMNFYFDPNELWLPLA